LRISEREVHLRAYRPIATGFGNLGANTCGTMTREPRIDFVDDGPGKPAGIDQMIGRRPIAAFGNSDGDLEMLQWTTGAGQRRLGVIVHHTDAEREYGYDRESTFGRLDKALAAAATDRWTVVDMKRDWKTVFPAGPSDR
jgi:hypothetical protein